MTRYIVDLKVCPNREPQLGSTAILKCEASLDLDSFHIFKNIDGKEYVAITDPSETVECYLAFQNYTRLVGAFVGFPSSIPNQNNIRTFPLIYGRSVHKQNSCQDDTHGSASMDLEPIILILIWLNQVLNQDSNVYTQQTDSLIINPVYYINSTQFDKRASLIRDIYKSQISRLEILRSIKEVIVKEYKRNKNSFSKCNDEKLNILYKILIDHVSPLRSLTSFQPVITSEAATLDIKRGEKILKEIVDILNKYNDYNEKMSDKNENDIDNGLDIKDLLTRWLIIANNESCLDNVDIDFVNNQLNFPSLSCTNIDKQNFIENELNLDTKANDLITFESLIELLKMKECWKAVHSLTKLKDNNINLYEHDIQFDHIYVLQALIECPFDIDKVFNSTTKNADYWNLSRFVTLWNFSFKEKWYITSGLKFGGDFLGYSKGSPFFSHSSHVIKCINQNGGYNARELIVNARLASSVRKKLLLSYLEILENKMELHVKDIYWTGWT